MPDQTGLPAASARDRLRRSRLYLPGNEPKYFINAGLHDVKTNPQTGVRQVSFNQHRTNLKEIIPVARRIAKKQFVWMNTTPCEDAQHNSRSKEFHRFTADVLSSTKAFQSFSEFHFS